MAGMYGMNISPAAQAATAGYWTPERINAAQAMGLPGPAWKPAVSQPQPGSPGGPWWSQPAAPPRFSQPVQPVSLGQAGAQPGPGPAQFGDYRPMPLPQVSVPQFKPQSAGPANSLWRSGYSGAAGYPNAQGNSLEELLRSLGYRW